ncbi:latrophilin-like protein LAT-2 [Phlebotomus argentipes]|uniref:latrophilin-like protein LAT-2 n=1 Tax=Phlebotomus argentipes TaxID=94469 RepID=UPI00289300C8|nr:latrophilin-like protein LAT-2 [Phlebotomus argentipes]
METLFTGHMHGFPPTTTNLSVAAMGASWGAQGGLMALGVVLGSSISLVGLAFAFITYSLFSDLTSLAGTSLLSFLSSLFMGQLLFVIGVGGVQDAELCLSLSLALLYMELASLCWLCCCCHHALNVFRQNANLIPRPEPQMGKALAHYSLLAWGFPLAMVAVAAAFKYKERDARLAGRHAHEHAPSSHCWLMDGSAYKWGFLAPAVILLLCGFWLAIQGGGTVKLTASLQIDSRARNKMIKRRGLQIGLFLKLLILLSFVIILGALASLWAIPELWTLYSIAQGAQGIVTSVLVTCNCRVLKLYTAPRSHRNRKGQYRSLRDGDGGRYGVLSVTNPNYEEAHGLGTDSEMEDSGTLIKMSYKEDLFTERCETKEPALEMPANGELSGALDISELAKDPPPQAV